MSERQLQDKQFYIDIYDLHTINECLDWLNTFKEMKPKLVEGLKDKDITPEKLDRDHSMLTAIYINGIKVHRYNEKEKFINKCMIEDQEKQNFYDRAAPVEIYCPKCNILLENFFKTLHEYDEKIKRVLFFYKCNRCNYRCGQYNTGEVFETKKDLCPKCKTELISTDKKKDSLIITTLKCPKCKHKSSSELNLEHLEWEAEKKANREKLEKYRPIFCDAQDCQKLKDQFESIDRVMKHYQETQKKEADPAFQKAKSLKKMKVLEVHKLLKEIVEKEGFTNLEFEKPEIGQFVVVPFVLQEAKEDRDGHTSELKLQKAFKSALEETNWRLMSEGTRYRAGYLSGRLKCYERDDDLASIIKSSF